MVRIFVCGYVVMPEHVHLLISEPSRSKLCTVLQMLKQNTAHELRPVEGAPLWEPRYYDFNVWSEAKRIEKLRHIHRTPSSVDWLRVPTIGRGAVSVTTSTGLEGPVEIESQWTARKRLNQEIVSTS